MSGVIDHGIRDDVTYFTLSFDYAERFCSPDGVIYAVVVDDWLRKLMKPVLYSASE